MSESTHQIKIRAKDQTSSAFKSIETSAKMTSSRISKMVGAAAVAASAFVGIKLLSRATGLATSTVAEMARLGEAASLAAATVDDLTKAVAALSTIGLSGVNITSFSKALATMQKTTGRSGLAGFYETIDALSQIHDQAKRAAEAQRVFSDVGLSFMPLISGSEQARAALREVVDIMPSLSQAAVDSSSGAKRAFDLFNLEVKYGFMQLVGDIVSSAEDAFNGPEGVAAAALKGANTIVNVFRVAINEIRYLWERLKGGFKIMLSPLGTFVGALAGGAGISDAFKAAKEDFHTTRAEVIESVNGDYQARKARIDQSYTNRDRDLSKLAAEIKKLRSGLGTQAKSTPAVELESKQPEAPEAKPKLESVAERDRGVLSNSLVLGATAEALRLSIIGPQTQNEMKKQTKLLEDIKSNVKKTADNSSSTSSAEYKELN